LEEGSIAAPGILAYGAHGGWTKEQFVTTIRTNTNPAGKELDNEFMPWNIYIKMTIKN